MYVVRIDVNSASYFLEQHEVESIAVRYYFYKYQEGTNTFVIQTPKIVREFTLQLKDAFSSNTFIDLLKDLIGNQAMLYPDYANRPSMTFDVILRNDNAVTISGRLEQLENSNIVNLGITRLDFVEVV